MEYLCFRSCTDPAISSRKKNKGTLEKGQQGLLLTSESPAKGKCKEGQASISKQLRKVQPYEEKNLTALYCYRVLYTSVQLLLGATPLFWEAPYTGQPLWALVWSVASIFFTTPGTYDPVPRLQVLLPKCHLLPPSLPCSWLPSPAATGQQKPRVTVNMAPAQHGPRQGGTAIQSGLCFREMTITCQSPCASSEVKARHKCCWRDMFSQWVINN